MDFTKELMMYPTIDYCVVLCWVYSIAHQAVGVGKEHILKQETKKWKCRRNTKPRKLLAGAPSPKVQFLGIGARRKSWALARRAVQSHSQQQVRLYLSKKNTSFYRMVRNEGKLAKEQLLTRLKPRTGWLWPFTVITAPLAASAIQLIV
jgi:hypothetical protein